MYLCRYAALIYSVTSILAQSKIGLFEYNYSIDRNRLKEEEKVYSGYDYVLSEDEQKVYNYLECLKFLEFNRTRDDFPPARPIKLHIDKVKQSQIYQVLKRFPKGGNLHLHHNHVVSKAKILDIIESSPFYDYLYVKDSGTGPWRLDFFMQPKNGYVKVKNNPKYNRSVLIQHSTLLGVMDDKALNTPTNSALRWTEIGPLFSAIGSHIVNQANISKLHMRAMLQSAVEENVQYLETKSSAYSKLYVLDGDPKFQNGKHFIDNADGELELDMVQEVVREFKKDNPQFIGYKRIINTSRRLKKYRFHHDIEQALRLYRKYPNLVSGFDIVGEEDKGYSLLFFLEEFANISILNMSFPYFFHVAETNWPDDLLTSVFPDDPVATMENIYDAILLGAKRVGHGIGFLTHPYLMEILKQKKVAVEANPVSNKMLGYVPDQRHHPAITYLRYGIPVVLGADDPATFGYNEFTLDWYEAFMGWGLNLVDLRHLAINSLQYSSLSNSEKASAMTTWENSWKNFIKNTKLEACQKAFIDVIPTISSIFPTEGHIYNETKIQVFGRNFQVSICKNIYCWFGSQSTKGTFVYNHMITCSSPKRPYPSNLINRHPYSVPFKITLDNNVSIISTNLTFSYMHNVHRPVAGVVGK